MVETAMRQPKAAASAATANPCSDTAIGMVGTMILAEAHSRSDPSTTVARLVARRAEPALGVSAPSTVFGVVRVKAIANPSQTGALLMAELLVARQKERNGGLPSAAGVRHRFSR